MSSDSSSAAPARGGSTTWNFWLLELDPHSAAARSGLPAPLRRALERYELAVAKDPLFARAWASLAEAYDCAYPYRDRDIAEDRRRAEIAAQRAIALDDRLPYGHAMLALVRLCLKWDFRGAETEYRRAIELDPQGAYAIVEHADLLRETRRTEQAAAEIRKARPLQPDLPVLAVKESEIQLDQNRPEAAVATARQALQVKRTYRRAWVALGMGLERLGDFEGALEQYRQALAIDPRDRRALPAYGYLLGVMGRKDEARAVARHLEDAHARVRHSAFQVAMVYAGLATKSARSSGWLARGSAARSTSRSRRWNTGFAGCTGIRAFRRCWRRWDCGRLRRANGSGDGSSAAC